jgi:hypothetical protein
VVRLVAFAVVLAVAGCTSTTAQFLRAPRHRGAPGSEPKPGQIGTITYSAVGTGDEVLLRQRDGERLIFETCGKHSEVIKEELVTDGVIGSAYGMPAAFGGATVVGASQQTKSWLIQFRCLSAPTPAKAPKAAPAPAPNPAG